MKITHTINLNASLNNVSAKDFENEVRNSFSASRFVVTTIEKMDDRDPVDMLRDLEILTMIALGRLDRIQNAA